MRITELLSPGDCRIDEALALAARVFNEVEAPIYSKSGAEHFMAFVNGRELRVLLRAITKCISARKAAPLSE